MNQPVHLLKKDALHLWPEILVSLGLLAAIVWAVPHTWGTPDSDAPWLYPLLSAFLKFLIPVAWLVLISRLVHDEPLVGDRQFWITRPYTWYGLLGAKLLFLLAFIYLPLLLCQAWLLHHAGLHPTLLAWPFLKNFAGITAVFILPLLAIAAVTSTFIRFALCVLGGFIYLIIVVVITVFAAPSKLSVPNMDYVQGAVLILLPLAAILLQYARRRTALARTLLLALPAVLLMVIVLTPASALIAHEYTKPLPLHAALSADERYQQHETTPPFTFKGNIGLALPVVFEGLGARAAAQSEHIKVSIDGPNGYHFENGWLPSTSTFSPGPDVSRLSVQLPKKVYDAVGTVPVSMHITLGVEQFEPSASYDVNATADPFPIPGHAACKLAPEGNLVCNFPFSNTSDLSVVADTPVGGCGSAGPTVPLPGHILPSAQVPNLDPVSNQPVVFGGMMAQRTGATLCPGTKLHFSELKSTGKGSMQFDIPSIVINAYAIRLGGGRPAQH